MYAHTRIIPKNGEPFVVQGNVQPSWGENAQGGLDVATIPGEYSDEQLDAAFGADVFIEVAGKVEFHGRVIGVNTGALIASSLDGALERKTRGIVYKVPMVKPWLDDLSASFHGGIYDTSIRDGRIRLTQKTGST